MNAVHIRQATPDDLKTLLEFEQGIIEAERPFDITLKRQHTQYYDLAFMLRAENVFIALAEMDSKPVGCGYARIEAAKPYLQHRWHAYLGFMYVLPAYRGKGINRQVIDVLKNWALSQGITELRLEVYSKNEAAVGAYKKAGFSGLLLEMRMNLEQQENS
jgi:GNAT superfamily N-acetyltransferase